MDPIYGYEAINVEAQARNPSSLLHWIKRIIAVRKNYKAFGRGSIKFLEPGNRKILAYVLEWKNETLLCVVNLSRTSQPVELDLSAFIDRVPVELLGHIAFPPIGVLPYLLTLKGYGTYGFRLATDAEVPYWHEDRLARPALPVLVLTEGWDPLLSKGRASANTVRGAIAATTQEQFQHKVLTPYLTTKRWFAAKGHRIIRIELLEQEEWNTSQGNWLLTIIEVHFADLSPQLYLLPLAICWEKEDGEENLQALAPWTLARIRQKEHTGVLFDAIGDDCFCRALVQGISQNIDFPFGKGRVEFRSYPAFGKLADGIEEPVSHPSLEQSNTVICFGNRLFLKGYRRLQFGTSQEVEVGRFLTEQSSLQHIVPVAGSIEFHRSDGQTLTLVLLQAYVENQGTGWNFAVDYLDRYLAEQLSEPIHNSAEFQSDSHGYFLTLMGVLGRRTAELHRAFCKSTGDVAFEPEPITPDNLTAWSDQLHTEAVATLDKLEDHRDILPPLLRAAVDRLLSLRPSLLERISPRVLVGISAAKMRYHGDYHLGQVLLVENDFVITDFEGEPARPIEVRRQKHSPLRDVASMLRSFSYVSSVAANRATTVGPADRHHLGPLVNIWEKKVAETFLKSYQDAIQGCVVWPIDPGAAERLIDFFVIDKALYELRYEMDNRPDWLAIPLFSLLRMFHHQGDTEVLTGDNS